MTEDYRDLTDINIEETENVSAEETSESVAENTSENALAEIAETASNDHAQEISDDDMTDVFEEGMEDVFEAELPDADTFESLDVKPEILRGLEELGFTQMTPIQKQAIPLLLKGRDVIGQAQTGTGKTAAFGIPLLQMVDPENKHLQAVILCPTRELAMQAADDLRDFAKYMHDVKVLPVYGGQEILRQIQGLRGTQIVVGTPGRVMDHMRRHTIRMDDVSMVILDEADEMLDMGFREDMETILGEITQEHQTCLFSATMPDPILQLTTQFQKNPELIKITQEELTVDSIHQYFYGVKHEFKTLALTRLLSFYRYKRCIIFCNTKSKVDELADTLTKGGFAAEGLHGDLTQKQRDSVMGRFRSGHLNILIATDIAARGIDVDDVEAVINYDIPMEAEYYVHRIGRTGRAGKEGVSHSLCGSKDFRKIHQIEAVIHAEMEERTIPSVDDIHGAQEQEALEKVMAVLGEGHSGELIPVVRDYCEEHGISIEAFAAAAVKMQMAEIPDDEIDVNLPKRSDRGMPRRRGRFGRREDFGGGDGEIRSPREEREFRRVRRHRRDEDGPGEEREPRFKREFHPEDEEFREEREPRPEREFREERKPRFKREFHPEDGEFREERKPRRHEDGEFREERKPRRHEDGEFREERKPRRHEDGEFREERKPRRHEDGEFREERKPRRHEDGEFRGERKLRRHEDKFHEERKPRPEREFHPEDGEEFHSFRKQKHHDEERPDRRRFEARPERHKHEDHPDRRNTKAKNVRRDGSVYEHPRKHHN